jgi:hypothetical protein
MVSLIRVATTMAIEHRRHDGAWIADKFSHYLRPTGRGNCRRVRGPTRKEVRSLHMALPPHGVEIGPADLAER